METARKPLKLIDTRTEVSPEEKIFLVQGSRKLPISTGRVSKYSLFFRYEKDQNFSDIKKPVNLLFKRNGDSLEIGPCLIFNGSELNGYSGCIVCIDDTYDIESLIFGKKVVKSKSIFNDLPLIVERKVNVRESFKNYTADLVYDMNVHKEVFDKQDLQHVNEPENVRKFLQHRLINNEGEKFWKFLNDKLNELEQIVSGFSDEEHQNHGFYFRKQIWSFILNSHFMSRTNLKPRGYPGDSEMMKMVYENSYQGNSTFEKLMHKFPLDQPGAQSVRNRIKIVSELINIDLKEGYLSNKRRMEVLSVACGPAVEIEDIIVSKQDASKYHFTLLDQDHRALKDASDIIQRVENKLGTKIKVDFVDASVRLLIAKKSFKEKLGKFDFIYSLGLFDYLSQRVASAVLENLYSLLKPNGRMIIGNFHTSNKSKYLLSYWLDWNLFHRTEKEFLNLIKPEYSANASIFFEDTKNQMFLNIIKKKIV